MALFFCGIFAISPAQASPKIDAEKNRLQATEAQIRDIETQRKLTEKALLEAKEASAKLQRDIVKKAARIDGIERDVLHQQRDIARLKKQEAAQHAILSEQESSMSRLVSAAWSLQHRPQLAAWMLPDKARERALTARSLHITTISLKGQMDTLNDALSKQAALREDIVSRRKDNEKRSASLQKERKTLEKDLNERQKLVLKIQSEQTGHMHKMAELTKDAADLQQLITNLEIARTKDIDQQYSAIRPVAKPIQSAYSTAERGIKNEPAPPPSIPRPKRANGTSFIQAKGSLPLPANGHVIGKFGTKRGMNDRLKGMEIRTLPSATVTSSFEGEVLFTGDFLDYGKMVIIRHSHDYHTLVAGLSRIDVTRGQFLLDGEPIGAMGSTDNMRKLYLELRKASQAINPKPWFALTERHYAKQ